MPDFQCIRAELAEKGIKTGQQMCNYFLEVRRAFQHNKHSWRTFPPRAAGETMSAKKMSVFEEIFLKI